MMLLEKLKYLKYYYVDAVYRLAYWKIMKKKVVLSKYFGKEVLNDKSCNDFIREGIKSGKPFMACRFGSTELRAVADTEAVDIKLAKTVREHAKMHLCTLSGFFPNSEESVRKFGHLMMDACNQADLFIIWYNVLEDYIIQKYAPQSKLGQFRGMEPYYHENPWTMALEGKKVLVIHPFVETIKKQYEKRELLFDNKKVLPKFELKTLRAVQTIAGETDERFETWFNALDYMYDEAIKIDFDVAIIGCGAYGLPLAAKLKEYGKQAIHVAGATQVIFGIKGKRWDDHPFISKLYNEHWTRPMESETPVKSKKVEDSCYW